MIHKRIVQIKSEVSRAIKIMICFCVILCHNTYGQTTVNSSNGYSVTVNLSVLTINPATTTNCAFGYNYTATLSYTITYAGSNIPSNLDNLQGNLKCGSSMLSFSLPNSGTGGTGTVTTVGSYTNSTNCAAVTPVSLSCNSIDLVVSGPGINYTTLNVVLPVHFASIDGNVSEKGNTVNWLTTFEENTAYFEVLKAQNLLNWQPIGRVEALGTSKVNQKYQFIDPSVQLDDVVYYRVKAVDKDNTYSYSSIISITNKGLSDLVALPNPSSNGIFKLVGISANDQNSLQLFNLMGQELKCNVEDDYINLSMLPKGIYLFKTPTKTIKLAYTD